MNCCVCQKTSVSFVASVLFLAVLLVPVSVLAQQSTEAGFSNFSNDRLLQLQESADKLRSEGQLAESASVYQELFLAIRANQGLYTEQQLQVLDRMIALDIDRRNWESLNQYLSYHEWLSNRLYAGNPVALSGQLQANSGHRLRAASYQQGPQRSWHLVQARTQLWRAVSALETLPAERGRLPDLWFQIANYHYALTNDAQRWLTSFEARTDEPTMISGWALGGNEVEQRSYEIGAELLQRIYDYYMRLPHSVDMDNNVLAATLRSYQGDWELMFNQSQRAFNFYEQSLGLASLTSCALELENFLFGRSVVLPVYSLNVSQASCGFVNSNIRPHQPDSASASGGASVEVEALLSRLYGQPKLRPNRKNGLWLSTSSLTDISNRSEENLDE